MAGKLFNISRIELNNIDYGTKPGFSLDLGGTTSEVGKASGRISGFYEDVQESIAEGNLEVYSDSDIEAIRKFNGNIVYYTDNGIAYAATECRVSETLKLKPGEGVAVKIVGQPATKV